MGIEVLPPNVNEGQLTFQVASEGKDPLRAGGDQGGGLQGRRGDRQGAGGGRAVPSLDDFFERVSTKEVGAGCVETLIRAGAFDCLGAQRAQLLAILPRAIQAGQAKQDDRKRGQRGLFDVFEAAHHAHGANGNGNGERQRPRRR